MPALGISKNKHDYQLRQHQRIDRLVCAFCCALFGAFFAEACARIWRMPAIVFLTPAIISVVPGSALYYTMRALVMGDYGLLSANILQTIYISAGLVVGAMVIAMLAALKNGETK